uniref:Vacuolar protein-sorting-associated protein 25 n=1 Tax=Romanomermis culicivorax TaxID=13658 RepID=A0A915HF46_ROMCU
MTEFEFPWQYQFPPFFTLQPNANTRQKQLECWSSFILEYCQVFKIYELDMLEAQQSPIFSNDSINRKLSKEGIDAVFAYLEKSMNWKTPEEWANVIYEWAVNNGFVNSVCTIFDLIHGDDSRNEAFHKIDQSVLMQALRHLQDKGKAELMSSNGNEGVKFF